MQDVPPPSGRLKLSPEGFVMATPEGEARRRYVASLDEDSCCSFDEWRDAGFMIKKGAYSCFRDITGVPQFTKEQVERPSAYPSIRKF